MKEHPKKGGSSKEQRLDESVVPEVPNLSTSSSYESRRVRKFQATWLRDFPWLVHESVADPGGGSGGSGPPPIRPDDYNFETEIITSTGSCITF